MVTKQELKNMFRTGSIPTGDSFADFIDMFVAYVDGKEPDADGRVDTDFKIIEPIAIDQPPSAYPLGVTEFFVDYDPNDFAQYYSVYPTLEQLEPGKLCVRTLRAYDFTYQQVDNENNGIFKAAYIRVEEDDDTWGPLVNTGGSANVVGYEYNAFGFTPPEETQHIEIEIPNLDLEKDILIPSINGQGIMGMSSLTLSYSEPVLTIDLLGGWRTTPLNPFVLQVLKQKPQTLTPINDASVTQKGIVQLTNDYTGDSESLAVTQHAVNELGTEIHNELISLDSEVVKSVNGITPTNGNVAIPTASDSVSGTVKVDATTIVSDGNGVISTKAKVVDNSYTPIPNDMDSVYNAYTVNQLIGASVNESQTFRVDNTLLPTTDVTTLKNGITHSRYIAYASSTEKDAWLSVVNQQLGWECLSTHIGFFITTIKNGVDYQQTVEIILRPQGEEVSHGRSVARLSRKYIGSQWRPWNKEMIVVSGDALPNGSLSGMYGLMYYQNNGEIWVIKDNTIKTPFNNKWSKLNEGAIISEVIVDGRESGVVTVLPVNENIHLNLTCGVANYTNPQVTIGYDQANETKFSITYEQKTFSESGTQISHLGFHHEDVTNSLPQDSGIVFPNGRGIGVFSIHDQTKNEFYRVTLTIHNKAFNDTTRNYAKTVVEKLK